MKQKQQTVQKEEKPNPKVNLKAKYQELRNQYKRFVDVEVLAKYKILSEAYKVGKKLYGNRFGIRTLAVDFDVSITSTRLLLTLDRANSKTWELIETGKISPHKVALIIRQKGSAYQDEVIDIVIKGNLGNEDIKKIKVESQRKMKESFKSVLHDKGYTEKKQAYRLFKQAIRRMNHFLTMDKKHFPKTSLRLIDSELIHLQNQITHFLENGRTSKDS